MKDKYIFLGNVLLCTYSTLALIFYVTKLFTKASDVYFFVLYDFKSLFLILFLHFLYWIGTISYLFKKKYFNNLVITFGAMGFLISGVADYILVSTYNNIFYFFYFLINIIILIAIGGTLYKILKISLSFIVLWALFIALAYNYLNSLLII